MWFVWSSGAGHLWGDASRLTPVGGPPPLSAGLRDQLPRQRSASVDAALSRRGMVRAIPPHSTGATCGGKNSDRGCGSLAVHCCPPRPWSASPHSGPRGPSTGPPAFTFVPARATLLTLTPTFPTRFGPCDPAAKPGFLSWGCPKIAPPSYTIEESDSQPRRDPFLLGVAASRSGPASLASASLQSAVRPRPRIAAPPPPSGLPSARGTSSLASSRGRHLRASSRFRDASIVCLHSSPPPVRASPPHRVAAPPRLHTSLRESLHAALPLRVGCRRRSPRGTPPDPMLRGFRMSRTPFSRSAVFRRRCVSTSSVPAFEMRTPIPIRVPPLWFSTTSAVFSSSTLRPFSGRCRSWGSPRFLPSRNRIPRDAPAALRSFPSADSDDARNESQPPWARVTARAVADPHVHREPCPLTLSLPSLSPAGKPPDPSAEAEASGPCSIVGSVAWAAVSNRSRSVLPWACPTPPSRSPIR